MAGREPAPEQLAAADVVADALGGRWESRDGEDAPPGMHDFDLILADGRCIALEVASAIDGAVVALSDAAFHPAAVPGDRIAVVAPEPDMQCRVRLTFPRGSLNMVAGRRHREPRSGCR